MTNTLCLDDTYSTTRLLTQEKPVIEKRPEDKLETVLFLPEGEGRKDEGGLRTKGYFKKSYKNKPLISIVTVVYNGKQYLEQTINSVLDQSYDNVEYIIIDGGSTDGTLDIIKKYDDQVDYWVSEPDTGIYDAMNKGATLCSGEYIAYLNADDWYFKDSIESVVKAVLQTNAGYIYGNMDLHDENGFVQIREPNLKNYTKYQPFGHQALFVKTKYIRQMPFDTRYKIAADYDLMVKLIASDIPYYQLQKSLVNFRMTGISSVADFAKEHYHIQYNHFGIKTAVYGYLIATKQPVILFFVKTLVTIKHFILKSKSK